MDLGSLNDHSIEATKDKELHDAAFLSYMEWDKAWFTEILQVD
ncbi:hypothetical protein [Bacillus sp. JCM 19041]